VEEAFTELRRCAGTQFDPELVEQFIDCVSSRNKSQIDQPVNVSKQTALQIGLQIEDLAGAVDRHDRSTLVALAERLKLTATKNGVSDIADTAGELERAVRENGEEIQLAELTSDLLDLCRATQRVYLSDPILGFVPIEGRHRPFSGNTRQLDKPIVLANDGADAGPVGADSSPHVAVAAESERVFGHARACGWRRRPLPT
jgi:hypothetical protein